MKRAYTRPQLVEYGRIDALTLGQGGNQPDFVTLPGAPPVFINNSCNPNLPGEFITCGSPL